MYERKKLKSNRWSMLIHDLICLHIFKYFGYGLLFYFFFVENINFRFWALKIVLVCDVLLGFGEYFWHFVSGVSGFHIRSAIFESKRIERPLKS